MVSARPKPGKNDSSLKAKLEKQIGKRVLHRGVAFKRVVFTDEWYAHRREIEEALSFYRRLLVDSKLLANLEQETKLNGKKKSGLGVHIRAAKVLEQLGKWVNTTMEIGHVSGVKVGDEFHWRCELSIAGLHRDFQKGIVYMKRFNGQILATSIVDSGRYDNVEGNTPNTFIYCGQGENPNFGREPKDQKLVGGNLALKNNFLSKMPVRVIRKVKSFDDSRRHSNSMAAGSEGNDCGYKFVYNGLYRVTKYWHEKTGASGTKVYKFLLEKIDEQQP